MASSTWLRATLPEEQAEPELTATPSRSSAISAVSAVMPGTAKQLVFGRRSGALAEHHGVGADGAQPRLQPLLQTSGLGGECVGLVPLPRQRRRQNRRCRRRSRCPSAGAAPARRRGSAARAAPVADQHHGADTLRSAELVARQDQHIGPDRIGVARQRGRPAGRHRTPAPHRRRASARRCRLVGCSTPVSLLAACTATMTPASP